MGLKKRSKVNAEFSMSSLTDIIFLLLIFFMLTANFVRVDNIDLPKSDSKTVAPTDVAVAIKKDGTYLLNGNEIPKSGLRGGIQRAVRESDNPKNATLTIVAESGVPTKKVHDLMKIASGLRMRAIIATQPKS